MKKIMMITGEVSGDIYGADLARHLFKQKSLKIMGIGGPRMRDAGVDILLDSSEISVVGISEVIPRLKAILKAYFLIRKIIRSKGVDIVILIDYPGFNLRIAGLAKRAGVQVVYYISPQIWAWRKGRLRLIAKRVKKMIVILPFEEILYKESGVDCSFIGHPLVDEAMAARPVDESISLYGLNIDNPVVGLFPGSRTSEIRTLLPSMIESAKILKGWNPGIQFVMALANEEDIITARNMMDPDAPDIKIIRDEANDVISTCTVIIAASGTVTLQAALFEKPTVIIYRLSPLTYFIARTLVKIEHIGLVNILAGKRVVPELLQSDVSPENISAEAKKMLADKEYRDMIVKELHEVKLKLGPPGASKRVAKVIAGML